MSNPNRALNILTFLMYGIRIRSTPIKRERKRFCINTKRSLLPSWSKDVGGIYFEVSMVGVFGMAEGAGTKLGGLGRTWFDP